MSALYPPIYKGATAGLPGILGLVPAGAAGDQGKFFRGDGTWVAIAGGGDMLAANNLSDVASAATSRTNLGLGSGNSPTFTGLTLSAPLIQGVGSAAAPTYTFTGNTGDGIYQSGAGSVSFAALGVATVRITTGGQIIGTTGGGLIQLGTVGQILATASGTNQSIVLTPSGTGGIRSGVDGTAAAPAWTFSNYTTTGIYAAAGPLLKFGTNGVLALTIGATQNANFAGNVASDAAGGSFVAGTSGYHSWTSRSAISAPADGQIALYNNAATDFTRLMLGGTTASFPAIKRSSATLAFRLADDSADAAISASAGTFSSAVNMATGQGVAWPAWQIYQTGSNFAVRDLTNSLNLMTYVGGTGVTGQATLLGNLIVSGTATSTFAGSVSVTGALSATTTVTDQSGVIGKRIADVITQNSHGFSVGQVLYSANGTWTKAKADALSTTYALGVVESVTTNTFVIVYKGPVTLSGLTVSTMYYLSDATAGATTTTAPTTTTSFVVPIFRTGTATQAYVEVGQPTSLAKINLTTDITGTLPVANGGTGITALGTGIATWWATPSSANLAAAVTDETGSGALCFATSPTLVTPVLGTPTSGNLSNCTADGTSAVGFREIPQNSKSAAYTTVLADNGKHIYHPSADTTARTFTIDSNANVAYPIGTAITFVNDTSAGTLTIAITTDTMVLLPGGTTGSRTLTAGNTATAIKVTATRWVISGTSGLT